jgi:transposase-like protein
MRDLTNPIFTNADKARKHLERLYWPNGIACRHCGNADPARITKLAGKSTRPGVHWCNECNKPFSVTVGTVMEDSKIPLNKWVLAYHLMAVSKKGMSALQLSRMLGITYKSAWFLCHRIRESMTTNSPSPIGGENKVVEADETFYRRQSEEPRLCEKGAEETRGRRQPFVPYRQREGQNASRKGRHDS